MNRIRREIFIAVVGGGGEEWCSKKTKKSRVRTPLKGLEEPDKWVIEVANKTGGRRLMRSDGQQAARKRNKRYQGQPLVYTPRSFNYFKNN